MATSTTRPRARYGIVLPPWFGDDTVKAAVGYYADHGVAPAGRHRYDPGAKWRHLAPTELVSRGLGFEQEIEPLHAQIRAACPAAADGVLIGGTGFRCVGILEALEHDGDISSDELDRAEKELEKITHHYVAEIDRVLQHKEQELLDI